LHLWIEEPNMKPVVAVAGLDGLLLAGLSRRILEMFARKDAILSIGRGALVAAVAALALTAIEPSAARAGSAAPEKGLSARHAVTDFSARRRYHRGDRYETAAYRHAGSDVAEAELRHAYWEAFNAYYGGGVVYDNHGPFYAEFGGYGSSVPPYLWARPPGTW
jgi:hypothetical protein